MNAITAIFDVLSNKIAAALSNSTILYLLVSAQINTAPDSLPNFRTLIQWLWTWQVHAGRLFMNLRNPPVTPANTSSVTDVRTHSVSVVELPTVEIPNGEAPDAGRKA